METMLAADCAKCLNPKRNDLKHVCERARARGRAARPAPSTERTCWSCLTLAIGFDGERHWTSQHTHDLHARVATALTAPA